MSKNDVGKNAREKLAKIFPCIGWCKDYSKVNALADFISGITIGLVIIPQSIAYVSLVGIPPMAGLISSVFGSLFYVIFGSVKEISVGPTAMMSLLTAQYARNLPLDAIGYLTFGCSCVGFFFSFLQFGVIIECISIPVTSAFATCVALIVIASEIKGILGIRYQGNGFFENLWNLPRYLHETKPGDVALGLSSFALLIFLDLLKDIPKIFDKRKKLTDKDSVLSRTLWFISISKNAITIFAACVVTVYHEAYYGIAPFNLTEPAIRSMPDMVFPIHDTIVGNNTITVIDKAMQLGSGIIIIPLVALLVHVSVAKSFDNVSVNVGRELLAVSLSNAVSSFFNSTPIAGAFTRSAVSDACKVATPFASVYTMIMCALACSFLTPYFRLIPKATLSAVIIHAIVVVIDVKIAKSLWTSCRKDFVVLCATLYFGLHYGIQFGLIAGVVVSVAFLLHVWTRPTIVIEKRRDKYNEYYAMVIPNVGLFFPSVDYLQRTMIQVLTEPDFDDVYLIVVNGKNFWGMDYTAFKGLIRIMEYFEKRGRAVLFINITHNLLSLCHQIDPCAMKYFSTNNNEFLKSIGSDTLCDKIPVDTECTPYSVMDERNKRIAELKIEELPLIKVTDHKTEIHL